MSDAKDEPKRIAPFTDDQITEADERIAQIEGILTMAKDLEEVSVITPGQVAELRKTLDTAKKIRDIMNRKLPSRK